MKSNKLAKAIKEARNRLNLTVRDVERLSRGKLSNPYVSQLENNRVGEPSPHALRVIARIMQLDYLRLLELAGYISKKDLTECRANRGAA